MRRDSTMSRGAVLFVNTQWQTDSWYDTLLRHCGQLFQHQWASPQQCSSKLGIVFGSHHWSPSIGED